MRVIYFHQHFSTPQGATGIRSYEMARCLIDKGHEVTMVCGNYLGGHTGLVEPFVKGKRMGSINGIKIIEFELPYSNNTNFFHRIKIFLKFALRSIKLVLTEKYDLVFATSTPLTASIPGIFARWFLLKPFVFEVRDLWPELPKAMGVIRNPFLLAFMSVLEKVSYYSANRIIALSPGMVNGVKKHGIPQERILLIPNGCDLGIFSQDFEKWRPSQITDNDFLAVYAGTHGIANGLGVLIPIAIELKRRGRADIKILLIGQGRLKAELQSEASVFSLDNLVFHEPVDKLTLAKLLLNADLGLQLLANVPAFYYGTSPNKFFDYIAAGLPVLTNYPGWIADLIIQNDSGFVIPPDNVYAFVDALEYAADHSLQLKCKGDNARNLAERDFNRSHLGGLFTKWLEEVV